jgi:hypothetical protein
MSKVLRINYETVCLQDPTTVASGAFQAVYDGFKSRVQFPVKSSYGIVKNIVGTASISPAGVPLSMGPTLIIWNLGPAASIDLGNIVPNFAGATVSLGYGIAANQIVTIPGVWFTATSTLSFSQPGAGATPYPISTNIALAWYI